MLNVIGPGVNSYIRFDLTALPANLTSSNVSKATLRLNINGLTTSGTFDVYLVTSSWTEGAITFNRAPTLGAKVTSAVMIPASKRNFIDVDVTPAVQAWLGSPTPAPNYGIALVPSSGSSISVSFDSKENTSTSHDPELSVALTSAGVPGQQGIQGIQGPPGPQGIPGPTGATGSQGLQGPKGPQGQPGPPGATGIEGPIGVDGAQGPQGPQGVAGQGFNFRSAFDGSATYAAYDVVSFNGSSYVSKVTINPGDPTPDVNPNWSSMAKQGEAGAQGSQGPAGPQGIPGNLALANFSCPTGQNITGFNASGVPVCSSGTGGGGGGSSDFDGDGIPDSIDPCPIRPNTSFNGVSYCPATTYDIARLTYGVGAAVFLSNVSVTDVNGSMITVAILPTDPGYVGDAGSTMTIDLGALPPPRLGDRTTVYGMVLAGQGLAPAAVVDLGL
jgi:hypothetical protein